MEKLNDSVSSHIENSKAPENTKDSSVFLPYMSFVREKAINALQILGASVILSSCSHTSQVTNNSDFENNITINHPEIKKDNFNIIYSDETSKSFGKVIESVSNERKIIIFKNTIEKFAQHHSLPYQLIEDYAIANEKFSLKALQLSPQITRQEGELWGDYGSFAYLEKILFEGKYLKEDIVKFVSLIGMKITNTSNPQYALSAKIFHKVYINAFDVEYNQSEYAQMYHNDDKFDFLKISGILHDFKKEIKEGYKENASDLVNQMIQYNQNLNYIQTDDLYSLQANNNIEN